MILVLLTIFLFQSSQNIASAYGVTVCIAMVITTIAFSAVLRWTWQVPTWRVLMFICVFVFVDLGFLAANLFKIPTGGWFSLLLGGCIALLLISWYYGERRASEIRKSEEMPIRILTEYLYDYKVRRFQGVGIFVSYSPKRTPMVFLSILKKIGSMPEVTVFLTIVRSTVPHMIKREKILVKHYGTNIYRIIARY